MFDLKQTILTLHATVHEWIFLCTSVIVLVFGVWLIPKATNLATNTAAGLAGQYLGPKQRTLVINSTTNLPELCLMLVSFLGLRRLGGIATPLGSNFANIYLMFLVAPLYVLIKWQIQGKSAEIKRFRQLIYQERNLVSWHILMSVIMFSFATLTYKLLTGTFQFVDAAGAYTSRSPAWYIVGCCICLLGVYVFLSYEAKLKTKRPILYDEIQDQNFEANPCLFLIGAVTLCLLCYLLNALFAGWTTVYKDQLAGEALFVLLHYFIGSLISSLPEITIAIRNYECLNAPDLNTALCSASQSNMSNLAIAALGSGLAFILLSIGASQGL